MPPAAAIDQVVRLVDQEHIVFLRSGDRVLERLKAGSTIRQERSDLPVDEQHGHGPSLTWTPDGKGLTVLADATLTTYDLTGEVLFVETNSPTDS